MSIHIFALITDPAQPEYNFFFRFTYLACDCTLWHCQTKPLRLAWHVCGIFSFPYLTQGCILNKQYKNKENLKPNQSFRHSWTSAYVYLFTAATFLHRALYFGLRGTIRASTLILTSIQRRPLQRQRRLKLVPTAKITSHWTTAT